MNGNIIKIKSNDVIDCEREDNDGGDEFEFEIVSPAEIMEESQLEIYKKISEIDDRMEFIDGQVEKLNSKIDKLTNNAEQIDYIIAVGSGVICGIIDSLFVGEFSFDEGKEWSDKKINDIVMHMAEKSGFDKSKYKGENPLRGSIKHLEKNFPIPSDGVWNREGEHYGINGNSHHLDDWAHHPSFFGLCCSLTTQFTGNAYFVNKYGEKHKIEVPRQIVRKVNNKTETVMLVGNDFTSKIFCGTLNWFMHLASDMAGSSKNAGAGMGLPGPIMTFLKEFSSLPLVRETDFPKKIGEFFENNNFDLRAELAVKYELKKQNLPIIINECIVRSFYFLRRLFLEIKEKQNLNDIDWEKTLPCNNRTIVRMLTIATGTMTAVDLADAGIRAVVETGGFNPETLRKFVLRVNFVGVQRFAVAVGTDAVMGISKYKKENERMRLRSEELQLLNAKIYYKQAGVWIAAENTEKAMRELQEAAKIEMAYFLRKWGEIDFTWSGIKPEGIRQNNPEIYRIITEEEN